MKQKQVFNTSANAYRYQIDLHSVMLPHGFTRNMRIGPYEKEIRCCARLEEASEGLFFMEFGEALKLVQVIAGARCKIVKNEILKALLPLNNVELTKARPGFNRFEIVEDQRGFS